MAQSQKGPDTWHDITCLDEQLSDWGTASPHSCMFPLDMPDCNRRVLHQNKSPLSPRGRERRRRQKGNEGRKWTSGLHCLHCTAGQYNNSTITFSWRLNYSSVSLIQHGKEQNHVVVPTTLCCHTTHHLHSSMCGYRRHWFYGMCLQHNMSYNKKTVAISMSRAYQCHSFHHDYYLDFTIEICQYFVWMIMPMYVHIWGGCRVFGKLPLYHVHIPLSDH